MENVYPEFCWWQGVVEDRNDPSKLGRVRVRIIGYHNPDKSVLPTSDLPLATCMQPITSAGVSGIGQSASGMVEGTHVVGFFADGSEGQIPIIMGTIAALSMSPPNEQLGFNDPNGKYPLSSNKSGRNTVPESDQSRLARGTIGEKHYSLATRRAMRVTGVPIAFAPNIEGDDPGGRRTKSSWDEPHPQGVSETKSQYPYNHVRETESGHVFEVDDTPGQERIHTYHTSGTFEEVHPDGGKVTKIVGEDYEISLKGKHMFVKGDLNLTVEGDMTVNVKGDYYEDITGNKYSTVRGTEHTKIQGNDVREVMSDYSLNIEGSRGVRVAAKNGLGVTGAGTDKETSLGSKTVNVGKNYNVSSALGNVKINGFTGVDIVGDTGNIKLLTLGDIQLGSGTTRKISISTGIFAVNAATSMSLVSSGALTVTTAAATYTHAATTFTTAAYSIVASAAFSVTATTIALN